MTNKQKAVQALALMIREANECNGDDKRYAWTKNSMKEGFYYGEHKMRGSMLDKLERYNGYYFLGTGYKMVADGNVKTTWNRRLDYGLAVLKFKLVQTN